ncbi:lipase maturation factor family protein [Haloglomus salinum]|uniref:lipase maturation factor family protein n=1 Tax=Haloglomus salinum TaxID=2962673 RepID=UPI0020C968A1|nr:lipase maturation factor family protein [Haloglomus salinum]
MVLSELGLPAGGSYWFARFLVRRGLALLYLLAFLVAAFQFRPLAGEDGLRPLREYVERAEFRERPSLFYYVPSDRAIAVAAWAGVGLAALALVGAPAVVPAPFALPASMLLWFLLWALYQSFVNAGGVFYGYGWESMLLEVGFLAVFLGDPGTAAPGVVVWLLRWVLFRNMFGAGLIKLRGDDCWRELTCMDYHYETQPIPNPLSWYAHHLPDRFHRVETLGNHVVELAVPFLYFAPQPFAAVAGVATIAFQGWLLLTGNFSWLNALTIVLALSVRPALNTVSETQVMNTSYDPLHLVNTYGAFGSITRDRYELVVQGTADEDPGPDTEWRTYDFKGKPTDPAERPGQVAPYHLRLDWQLWFAAMAPTPRRSPWFPRFLRKLLEGDEATRSLLAHDPFPDGPPEHVRAVRYRYAFTSPAERAETGRWWSRERVGTYVRPISEGDLGSHRFGAGLR